MNKITLALLSTLSILSLFQSGKACTDFSLKAKDNSMLVSRTMEFSANMNANLRSSTRGRTIENTLPSGAIGMSWKAKYGYVSLDAFNVDVAVDGMNEAGLSLEALYLPGETQYQDVPTGHENQALSYINFGDWVLGNFKTVDEVRAALMEVYVYSQPTPGMGEMIFPLHFAIYDASGKGIVVEFVKGKMNVYDNDLGVLTNTPSYPWQVTNIANYVNLSPFTPAPLVDGTMTFITTGQGGGMKGLPGDISPPSRFVKMSLMKAFVYQPDNISGALNLAQHMIDNVDIPLGFVQTKQADGKILSEFTQWTVFKDLTNKIFYYKTYNNTTVRSVALSKVDFSENAKRLKMPIDDKQYVLDYTKQFLQSK